MFHGKPILCTVGLKKRLYNLFHKKKNFQCRWYGWLLLIGLISRENIENCLPHNFHPHNRLDPARTGNDQLRQILAGITGIGIWRNPPKFQARIWRYFECRSHGQGWQKSCRIDIEKRKLKRIYHLRIDFLMKHKKNDFPMQMLKAGRLHNGKC